MSTDGQVGPGLMYERNSILSFCDDQDPWISMVIDHKFSYEKGTNNNNVLIIICPLVWLIIVNDELLKAMQLLEHFNTRFLQIIAGAIVSVNVLTWPRQLVAGSNPGQSRKF